MWTKTTIKRAFRLKKSHLTTIIISIFLVLGLILYNNALHVNDFHNAQIKIAQKSTAQLAQEISQLLKEKQRLSQLFVAEHKTLILDALKTRHSDDLVKLGKKIKSYFPDSFTFILTDQQGNPPEQYFNDMIGEVCKQDIHTEIKGLPVKIRIHPNAYQYHYDIISPVYSPHQSGFLLISFPPDSIARLLRTMQPEGQKLLLLTRGISPLIEIDEFGSRDQNKRDNYLLSAEQQQSILASNNVALSNWKLVSIPKPGFYAQYHQNRLQQMLINALLLLLIFSYSLLSAIQLDRKRQRMANLLLKARSRLRSKIQQQTKTLKQANKELQQQIEKSKQLAQEKTQFASLVTGSPDPILRCDSFGIVTYQNTATDRLLNELDLDDIVDFLPDTHEEQVELAKYVTQCVANVTIEKRHFHYVYNYVQDIDETFIYIQETTKTVNYEHNLLANQAEMEAIFRSCPDAIIYTDKAHIIRKVNNAVSEIYGYQPEQLVGKSNAILYPDQEKFQRFIHQCDGACSTSTCEVEQQNSNGDPIQCEAARSTIYDTNNQVIGYVCIVRDIRERKQAEQKIRDNERFLSNLTSVLAEGIYVIDKQVNLVYMNNEAEDLLGWSFNNLKQKNIHETIHNLNGLGVKRDICPIYNTLKTGQVQMIEDDFFFRSDGTKFPVRYTVAAMRNEQEEITGAVVAFQDITEQKQLQKELEIMATIDPVSQINNRRTLELALEQEFQRAQRYKRSLSLFMLDIDHFKKINDQYGHQAGDEALFAFAQLLKKEIRESDFVGRYGGEEFVVLLPETNLKTATKLAERLRQATQHLKVPTSKGEVVHLTVSIGVSSYPETANTIESLQTNADHAVYRAKHNGRNQVQSASAHDIKVVKIN